MRQHLSLTFDRLLDGFLEVWDNHMTIARVVVWGVIILAAWGALAYVTSGGGPDDYCYDEHGDYICEWERQY